VLHTIYIDEALMSTIEITYVRYDSKLV
jgi:hypothetical protein